MLTPLKRPIQVESCENLSQNGSKFNKDRRNKQSLLSLIKPKPNKNTLEGIRTIRFIGFKTGQSRYGKNIISLLFRDIETDQQIGRTVNIDPHLSAKSYFTKYLTKLIGNSETLLNAVTKGGEALEELINEQKGRSYEAICSPSTCGQYTNIDDFRASRAKEE